MDIKKGFIFTGCQGAFTGRVEVLKVDRDNNKLKVWLTKPLEGTTRFSEWEEEWDLQVVEMAFGNGTYYTPNKEHFAGWPDPKTKPKKMTQDDVDLLAIKLESMTHNPQLFAQYMSEEMYQKALNTPEKEFQKKFRKAFEKMEMSWGTMF